MPGQVWGIKVNADLGGLGKMAQMIAQTASSIKEIKEELGGLSAAFAKDAAGFTSGANTTNDALNKELIALRKEVLVLRNQAKTQNQSQGGGMGGNYAIPARSNGESTRRFLMQHLGLSKGYLDSAPQKAAGRDNSPGGGIPRPQGRAGGQYYDSMQVLSTVMGGKVAFPIIAELRELKNVIINQGGMKAQAAAQTGDDHLTAAAMDSLSGSVSTLNASVIKLIETMVANPALKGRTDAGQGSLPPPVRNAAASNAAIFGLTPGTQARLMSEVRETPIPSRAYALRTTPGRRQRGADRESHQSFPRPNPAAYPNTAAGEVGQHFETLWDQARTGARTFYDQTAVKNAPHVEQMKAKLDELEQFIQQQKGAGVPHRQLRSQYAHRARARIDIQKNTRSFDDLPEGEQNAHTSTLFFAEMARRNIAPGQIIDPEGSIQPWLQHTTGVQVNQSTLNRINRGPGGQINQILQQHADEQDEAARKAAAQARIQAINLNVAAGVGAKGSNANLINENAKRVAAHRAAVQQTKVQTETVQAAVAQAQATAVAANDQTSDPLDEPPPVSLTTEQQHKFQFQQYHRKLQRLIASGHSPRSAMAKIQQEVTPDDLKNFHDIATSHSPEQLDQWQKEVTEAAVRNPAPIGISSSRASAAPGQSAAALMRQHQAVMNGQQLPPSGMTRKQFADFYFANPTVQGSSGAMAQGARSFAPRESRQQPPMTLLQRMGSSMERLSVMGASAGILYGGVSAVNTGVKQMMEFEAGMVRLQKAAGPATGSIKELGKAAIQMGEEFGQPITHVMESMEMFARQGRSQTDVIQQTRTAMMAANVTDLQGVETTDALIAAQKQFGLASSDSMRILDSWSAIQNRTSIGAKVLVDALKIAGVIARQSGVSFDQFNGTVAAMAEVTRRGGEDTGNALKHIMQAIRQPEAIEALQEVGVKSEDARGNFKNFGQVITELHGKWDGLTDVQRQNIAISIAGTRRFNDFYVEMETFGRANSLTALSLGSTGTAMRSNALVTQSLAKQVDQLKAGFEGLWASLGQSGALDVLKQMTTAVKGTLDLLAGVNKVTGKGLGGMMGTVGGAAAVAAPFMWMMPPGTLTSAFRRPQAGGQAGAMPAPGMTPADEAFQGMALGTSASMGGPGRRTGFMSSPFASRYMYPAMGIMATHAAASGLHAYFDDPQHPEKSTFGGMATDVGSSLVSGALLTKMIKQPGGWGEQGMGNKIGMIAVAVTTVAQLISSIKGHYDQQTVEAKTSAQADSLRGLGEYYSQTNNDLHDAMASTRNGAQNLDAGKMMELTNQLSVLSPNAVKYDSSGNPAPVDFKTGAEALKAAANKLPEGIVAVKRAAIENALKSAEVTGAVQSRHAAFGKSQAGGMSDEEKGLNLAELNKASAILNDRLLQPLHGMAIAGADAHLGVSQDVNLIKTIAKATGVDTETMLGSFLSQRFAATGLDIDAGKLAKDNGTSVEGMMTGAHVRYDTNGPVYDISSGNTLSDAQAAKSKVIELDRDFNGVVNLTSKRIEQFTSEYIRAIKSLAQSNQDVIVSQQTVAQNLASARDLMGTGGGASTAGIETVQAAAKAIHDINANSIRDFQPTTGTQDAGNVDTRYRELIGQLTQATESGKTMGLRSIVNGGYTLSTETQKIGDQMRRAIDSMLQNGGVTQSRFTGGGEEAPMETNAAALVLQNILGQTGSLPTVLSKVSDSLRQQKAGDTAGAAFSADMAKNIAAGSYTNQNADIQRQIAAMLHEYLANGRSFAKDSAQQYGEQYGYLSRTGQVGSKEEYLARPDTQKAYQALVEQRNITKAGYADSINNLADYQSKPIAHDDAYNAEVVRLTQKMDELSSGVAMADAAVNGWSRNIGSVEVDAENASDAINRMTHSAQAEAEARGLTGVNAAQFVSEQASQNAQAVPANAQFQAPGQAAQAAKAFDLTKRGAVLMAANTKATRDLTLKYLGQNTLTAQMTGGFGIGDATGTHNGIESLIGQIREKFENAAAKAAPMMAGMNSSDKRDFMSDIMHAMGPLGAQAATLGRLANPQYQQAYLMSSDSSKAMAGSIQEAMRQGTSATDLFADPYMRASAKEDPLVAQMMAQVVDTGIATQLQKESNTIESNLVSSNERLNATIQAWTARMGGSVAPVAATPTSKAAGSLNQANTGSVDAMGRIRRDGTAAILHEGEIVLNKNQAGALLRNRFAAGTMPEAIADSTLVSRYAELTKAGFNFKKNDLGGWDSFDAQGHLISYNEHSLANVVGNTHPRFDYMNALASDSRGGKSPVASVSKEARALADQFQDNLRGENWQRYTLNDRASLPAELARKNGGTVDPLENLMGRVKGEWSQNNPLGLSGETAGKFWDSTIIHGLPVSKSARGTDVLAQYRPGIFSGKNDLRLSTAPMIRLGGVDALNQLDGPQGLIENLTRKYGHEATHGVFDVFRGATGSQRISNAMEIARRRVANQLMTLTMSNEHPLMAPARGSVNTNYPELLGKALSNGDISSDRWMETLGETVAHFNEEGGLVGSNAHQTLQEMMHVGAEEYAELFGPGRRGMKFGGGTATRKIRERLIRRWGEILDSRNVEPWMGGVPTAEGFITGTKSLNAAVKTAAAKIPLPVVPPVAAAAVPAGSDPLKAAVKATKAKIAPPMTAPKTTVTPATPTTALGQEFDALAAMEADMKKKGKISPSDQAELDKMFAELSEREAAQHAAGIQPALDAAQAARESAQASRQEHMADMDDWSGTYDRVPGADNWGVPGRPQSTLTQLMRRTARRGVDAAGNTIHNAPAWVKGKAVEGWNTAREYHGQFKDWSGAKLSGVWDVARNTPAWTKKQAVAGWDIARAAPGQFNKWAGEKVGAWGEQLGEARGSTAKWIKNFGRNDELATGATMGTHLMNAAALGTMFGLDNKVANLFGSRIGGAYERNLHPVANDAFMAMGLQGMIKAKELLPFGVDRALTWGAGKIPFVGAGLAGGLGTALEGASAVANRALLYKAIGDAGIGGSRVLTKGYNLIGLTSDATTRNSLANEAMAGAAFDSLFSSPLKAAGGVIQGTWNAAHGRGFDSSLLRGQGQTAATWWNNISNMEAGNYESGRFQMGADGTMSETGRGGQNVFGKSYDAVGGFAFRALQGFTEAESLERAKNDEAVTQRSRGVREVLTSLLLRNADPKIRAAIESKVSALLSGSKAGDDPSKSLEAYKKQQIDDLTKQQAAVQAQLDYYQKTVVDTANPQADKAGFAKIAARKGQMQDYLKALGRKLEETSKTPASDITESVYGDTIRAQDPAGYNRLMGSGARTLLNNLIDKMQLQGRIPGDAIDKYVEAAGMMSGSTSLADLLNKGGGGNINGIDVGHLLSVDRSLADQASGGTTADHFKDLQNQLVGQITKDYGQKAIDAAKQHDADQDKFFTTSARASLVKQFAGNVAEGQQVTGVYDRRDELKKRLAALMQQQQELKAGTDDLSKDMVIPSFMPGQDPQKLRDIIKAIGDRRDMLSDKNDGVQMQLSLLNADSDKLMGDWSKLSPSHQAKAYAEAGVGMDAKLSKAQMFGQGNQPWLNNQDTAAMYGPQGGVAGFMHDMEAQAKVVADAQVAAKEATESAKALADRDTQRKLVKGTVAWGKGDVADKMVPYLSIDNDPSTAYVTGPGMALATKQVAGANADLFKREMAGSRLFSDVRGMVGKKPARIDDLWTDLDKKSPGMADKVQQYMNIMADIKAANGNDGASYIDRQQLEKMKNNLVLSGPYTESTYQKLAGLADTVQAGIDSRAAEADRQKLPATYKWKPEVKNIRHAGGLAIGDVTLTDQEFVVPPDMAGTFRDAVPKLQELLTRMLGGNSDGSGDMMSGDAKQFAASFNVNVSGTVTHTGAVQIVPGEGLAELIGKLTAIMAQQSKGAPLRTGDKIFSPLTGR